MVRSISFLIAFFGIMFLLTASTFALPPLPPGGSRPGQPGGADQAGGPNPPDSPGTQLPPQPSLPPCPECDKFATPTPTTGVSIPTPTLEIGGVSPTITSQSGETNGGGGGGDGRSDGRSDGRGGVGGTSGQVLGLASASGESELILKQIGAVWMLIGLGLIGFSQKRRFFGN